MKKWKLISYDRFNRLKFILTIPLVAKLLVWPQTALDPRSIDQTQDIMMFSQHAPVLPAGEEELA